MEIEVNRLVDWNVVLNSARTTIGKGDLNKEPSDTFKLKMLVSEHSPIRNLTYEVVWRDIPYWTAMHLRTHHIGFHSGEDDLVFVQTQRTDRTEINRDNIPQNAPVTLRAVMNAHSIINISRVRLCRLASKETIEAWDTLIEVLKGIEPILSGLCAPNCIYRGFCPEGQTCGYYKAENYKTKLENYRNFVNKIRM